MIALRSERLRGAAVETDGDADAPALTTAPAAGDPEPTAPPVLRPVPPAPGARTADPAADDSPEVLRSRALAVVEYLIAVRGLVDQPARTVDPAGAFWLADLPDHPSCQLGPRRPGDSWLRVGRPAPPPPPRVHSGSLRSLLGELSAAAQPGHLPGDGALEPVQAEFGQWYEQQWQPWARAQHAAEATCRLHDRLREVRGRVAGGTTLELVWGHLVLTTWTGSGLFRYPLLATGVRITYEPGSATVSVAPTGPPRLQVAAITALGDAATVWDLSDPDGRVDLDPADKAARHRFATRVMQRLDLEPRLFTDDGAEPGGRTYVHDTQVLFARSRHRPVGRFLEAMRDRLTGTAGTANTAVVDLGALAGVLCNEPSRLPLTGAERDGWPDPAEPPLLPLAASAAQESVVRRLAGHRTVAVQGAAGTGKSHTIRNLACHLAAHGKRVLVVAPQEGPLRALREHLPEPIRPLCVPLLGSAADQAAGLRLAARELSDRAATLDQDAQEALVRRLRRQLDEAEGEQAEALARLADLAAHQPEALCLDGAPMVVSQVGAWLHRHADDALVPDDLPVDADPPLDEAEFGALFEIARRVPAADRAASLDRLPPCDQLPDGRTAAVWTAAAREARDVRAALRQRGVAIDAVRLLGAEGLGQLAARLRHATGELSRAELSWTGRLVRLVREPAWQARWDDHATASRDLLAEAASRNSMLAGHRVELPDEHAERPRRLLAQLTEIGERLATGRGFRWLSHAELARVSDECRVDGEPLASVRDVDLAVAAVERAQVRRELTARWVEWERWLGTRIRPGGAPPPVPALDSEPPEFWVSRLLTLATEALTWHRYGWPALHARLAQLYPACPGTPDSRTLADLAALAHRCHAVLVADHVETRVRAVSAWLTRGPAGPPEPAEPAGASAAPLLRGLALAWQHQDFARWDACLAAARRLWRVRPDAQRYAALRARLAHVAPRWAAEIDTGTAPAAGADALRAWRWRQAQSWFERAAGPADADALWRAARGCRDRIDRLRQELVAASAWLRVARALDDRRRAALADLGAALAKAEQDATHWQPAAQRALAGATAAVPIWVMPIERALEQFGAGGPHFDVVIVDEAPAADLFALPVLTLGRRCVVVGDDQQSGPRLPPVPGEDVTEQIRRHLVAHDVPSAEHFDPASSLWDHALRRAPQRVLLTEQFRAVPAIAGFGNEHHYRGALTSMRTDPPAGFPPAIIAVRVPDGLPQDLPGYGDVNAAEAAAVVDRVAGLVADPAHEGDSVAVICLPGGGQVAYLRDRLRDRLGTELAVRGRVRVGDPYAFQGEEHDLVLICFVAADGAIPVAGAELHRRVNLAVSRARDRLWLFHSMDVTDLDPEDPRARLLVYAHRPPPVDEFLPDPQQRCATDVARAVLHRMTAAGLRPVPRFAIGGLTADLVVAAPDGRRLAVACDGASPADPGEVAAELRRQLAAEEVGGCDFVRVRASAFHRDPEAALRPVWQRAKELGIIFWGA